MNAFGFSGFEYFLSTRTERGPTDEIAEQAIVRALESHDLAYEVDAGGGAFYGPKLDINLRDAIGRRWQLGTVQVDFELPERFDLTYRGPDGLNHRPVMIHRALAGSIERFFAVLIEHFAGAFPAWIAPVQAVVTPISEHQLDYGYAVRDALRARGFRVDVDASNEKLGYKIRHWKTQKLPYILVVGKSEAAEGMVNINERGHDDKRTVSIDAFADELAARVAART
jgi:threonyl-tRNA synthetase